MRPYRFSDVAVPFLIAIIACTEPIASPPAPAELVALKGAPIVVIPGGKVDTISVQLLSMNGQPVSGYHVQWSGDGQVVPLDDVTDDLGLAHATWIMPRYPDTEWIPRPIGPSGDYSAQAAVGDLPAVHFSTTARSLTVDRMDAGGSAGCGVRSGELLCWGASGGETRAPRRVPLPTGVRAKEVQVGWEGVCILDTTGDPWCKRFWPVDDIFRKVSGAPHLVDLDKGAGFSATSMRLCARSEVDHTPWCWMFSEEGTEPATQMSTRTFTAVQAGFDFWCGLDDAGAVWCHGDNSRGQLGDGTFAPPAELSRVQGLPPVVALHANAAAACAANAAGKIWCWGFGPHGYESNVPVEITVPGIHGTILYISGTADGFVIHDGEVRGWWASVWLDYLFIMARHFRAVEVRGDGQVCVRAESGEVFCSWILALGGGDTSPFPSQLVPLTPIP